MNSPWAVGQHDEYDGGAPFAVGAVALVVAGALAVQSAIEHVSPTGSQGTDVVLVGLLAGFVAWAGASARWWAVSAFGGVAAITSGPSWWTIPALIAVSIGLVHGIYGLRSPWLRSAAAGGALLALMRADLEPLVGEAFFGASALVVGIVTTAFVVIAIGGRSGPVRRRMGWCLAAVGALCVLCVVGLVVAGLQAKDDLVAGRDHVTDGLDQLRDGDTPAAAASLRAAATELRGASNSLGGVLSQPSRLIPVVAQHRGALDEIVSSAADAALAAANALDLADIDELRVSDGTIDVESLASFAEPFENLTVAVEGMADALEDVDSPWLIGEVQRQVAEGLDDIGKAAVQARATAAAAEHGPRILGIDGVRHYLVVFTAPGEARGQSGVITNWAEITITNGRIRQSDFGRTADLIADLAGNEGVVLDVAPEYFEHYGSFGAGGPDEAVEPGYWSDVTMSPDTPTVASVVAQLYAGGGRGTIDGVFAIDPIGLASLLQVGEPLQVEGLEQEIDAVFLEQFLLVEQYRLDESTRRDLVEAVVGLTLQQFLSTSLPEPQLLGSVLAPVATEGHIVAWARRPPEQEMFRLIGMAGQLPEPEGRDGLAVVTNNAGGSPLDSFLGRTARYTATYDPGSGRVEAELVVTLSNDAPLDGFAEDVTRNDIGLPAGTNRTLLTVYTPLEVDDASIDDEPITFTSGRELGWNTTTVVVDIPAGDTRTLRFDLAGTVSTDGYAFVWRAQPLARPDTVSIDVRSTDEGIEASYAGELARLTIVDRDGHRALR